MKAIVTWRDKLSYVRVISNETDTKVATGQTKAYVGKETRYSKG